MLNRKKKKLILERAKEAIEAGWCQGTYARIRDDKLCVCAVGALRLAYIEIEHAPAPDLLDDKVRFIRDLAVFPPISPRADACIDSLVDELSTQASDLACRRGMSAVSGIVEFNDRRSITQADVLSVFDAILGKYSSVKPRRRLPKAVRGSDA